MKKLDNRIGRIGKTRLENGDCKAEGEGNSITVLNNPFGKFTQIIPVADPDLEQRGGGGLFCLSLPKIRGAHP